MKLSEIVGKNITHRRQLLGISQKELAIRLDITQDSLNRMERGKIAPKMSRLEAIAIHLKCPVAELFRIHSDTILERAATIADIIAPLPDSDQKALVNLLAETVRIMQNKID